MNVLYDHQAFSMQIFGGISKYFVELFHNFSPNINCILPKIYTNNHYIQQSANFSSRPFLPSIEFKGKKVILSKINNIKQKYTFGKIKYDIFHPTYYDPYFLNYLNTKPFVLTVHDMTHEKFPHLFSKNDRTIEWKKFITTKADRIIAVSENTKQDLIDILKINPRKIKVIYHGYSKEEFDEEKFTKYLFKNRYILFVGERKRHKNFYTFVSAIEILLKTFTEMNVICLGGGEFTKEELMMFENKKMSNIFHQFSVPSDVLYGFYKHAELFVYPSLYEGFGMPILEAFANNCPTALSNSSCFYEIAKDAAIYFDPTDKQQMAEQIKNILTNNKLKEGLIIKSKERLNHFSWQKSAKQTEIVYNLLY